MSCFADPSEPASFWNGACRSTADTDRTFEQFLALCQEAGPLRPGRSRLGGRASRGGARAATAGTDPGPVGHTAWRADPRGGADPAQVRRPAHAGHLAAGRGLLGQAAEGDASATGRYLVDLTTPARGTVCPSDRLPFDPDFGARRSS